MNNSSVTIDFKEIMEFIREKDVQIDFLIDKKNESEQRINKAIEYIEKGSFVSPTELLNILKGDNNE